MNTKQKVVLTITLILLILSGWFLYPTIDWYTRSAAERKEGERMNDPLLKKILKLGLDLKGGMHIVMEVDTSALNKGTTLPEAMNRAVEVIRNRIDQMGVAEPLLQKQGSKWIVVQLPGIEDPERAVDIIGKTALLEFKLVEDDLKKMEDIVGGKKLSDVLASPELQAKLLEKGYQVLPGKNDDHFLVKKDAELTGSTLTDAKVEFGGQFNQPHVQIAFNNEGAVTFAKITGDNINRRLAIVLDGKVQSAPVIRSKIPEGKGIIEGSFTTQEASDLALILRSGSLPVPLKIVENRTVGPSLGQDSIVKGVTACVLGAVIVFVFMFIYYKFSGLIADMALILNLFLLVGAMAALRSTLTLPGIAGVALTLGMAVDANVLIFERIREELRRGKTIRVAVDAGYEKAFVTILDSNLTTLIAAAFLFQFGTGPIKGFAVTLCLGIIISMFTAISVTHLVYDWMLSEGTKDKLSI
jgi:protein-export membrane protein SecD